MKKHRKPEDQAPGVRPARACQHPRALRPKRDPIQGRTQCVHGQEGHGAHVRPCKRSCLIRNYHEHMNRNIWALGLGLAYMAIHPYAHAASGLVERSPGQMLLRHYPHGRAVDGQNNVIHPSVCPPIHPSARPPPCPPARPPVHPPGYRPAYRLWMPPLHCRPEPHVINRHSDSSIRASAIQPCPA